MKKKQEKLNIKPYSTFNEVTKINIIHQIDLLKIEGRGLKITLDLIFMSEDVEKLSKREMEKQHGTRRTGEEEHTAALPYQVEGPGFLWEGG